MPDDIKNVIDDHIIGGDTDGQMAYFNGSEWVAIDTTGLFWDNINKRFSIGGEENEMTLGGVTKGHTFTTHSQGGGNAFDITFHRHSATSGTFLAGARSRGSEASEIIVNDDDNLLCMFGVGYDGTDYEIASQIDFEIDGTPGDNDMPGRIVFSTTASGESTPTEHMRINKNGHIVLKKVSTAGIKIDLTTPTFGWRDLTGKVVEGTGANKPTHSTYRNGVKQFLFSVGDETFINYHVPHDYVKGSDIHLHIHWSHIDAGVTGGTITFDGEITYAKGHQQSSGSVFPASITTQIIPTVEAVPFKHMVSEIQLSATSPSGIQLDSDDIEPDGMIISRIEFSADNMTGANPSIFIHEVDIHYQSTNIATKDKEPDFYV